MTKGDTVTKHVYACLIWIKSQNGKIAKDKSDKNEKGQNGKILKLKKQWNTKITKDNSDMGRRW